jgi:hypothetical protein
LVRFTEYYFGDQTKEDDVRVDESCSIHRGDKKHIRMDLKPEMKRPHGGPRCKWEYIVTYAGFA